MEVKTSVRIKNKDIDTIELAVFEKMEFAPKKDFHMRQNNLDQDILRSLKIGFEHAA